MDMTGTASNEDQRKELIKFWINQGWKFRGVDKMPKAARKEYRERVHHEMGLIEGRGFIDYFLFLSDAVRWAKDNKIPVGPARGSAAASLICYLLRITEVNPMDFPHMLFERFIDPTRTELPDVDLDFSDDRRIEVKQYLERKYGKDRVGNIGNFTRYRGKNSIDDVARVYNIPSWECETVKDLIIERSGGDSRISDSLEDTFEMFPKAKAVLERHPELARAIQLEGNYRGMGVHAAGLVISNTPITDTCAVYTRTRGDEEVQVIAYDKKDGEYVGMLKADFLGLSTMGMIGRALETIGMDLEDLYRIPLDDQKTLDAFREGDVTGIFQFEGRATRIVCNDVSPEHFQHLADINALSRPGPLFSGMTAQYCDVKHGRAKPISYHPIVDNLTGWTYGQVVYQEQVLSTIRELGGFPMSEVHSIRKIISQKLGEAQFEAKYKMFEENACQNHGCTPELALKIWRFLSTSATYSFCVTGDTILERAATGIHCPSAFVTVSDLYNAQQSKTPVGEKMRYRGIKILGMDDDSRIRPNRLIKIHDPVPVQCYKIITNTGRSVTISKDHRILTSNGYLHTSSLSIGTNVVVSLGKEGRAAELHQQYLEKHPGQKYDSWAGKERYDISGCANPAWIDGRTGFIKEAHHAVRERDQDKCKHCGKESDGSQHSIEFAHIMTLTDLDGDYSRYHNVDNMMQLCNSCHKKFDYRIQGTRTKRWTYGRPTGSETIVSIEDVGQQLVYDISMEGPSHNYQGNGFIHHNNIAHCISYSMLAFWQMWIKVHHPTAFYAAQLTKVGDDKLHKLMSDAVRHGQSILAPDLWESDVTWKATKSGVRAGFLQIPGIGPKTAEAAVTWRNEKKTRTPIANTNSQIVDIQGSTVVDLDYDAQDAVSGWQQLTELRGIGPKTIEKILQFVEAEDPFGLETVRKVFKQLRALVVPGNEWGIPAPTHVSSTIPKTGVHDGVVWMGIPRSKNYQDYVENQRSRYGKEIEEIQREMKDPHLVKSCVVRCFDDFEDDVYCRWNRYQFPKFERMLESLRCGGSDVLIVRGRKLEDFGVSIHVRDAWVLNMED